MMWLTIFISLAGFLTTRHGFDVTAPVERLPRQRRTWDAKTFRHVIFPNGLIHPPLKAFSKEPTDDRDRAQGFQRLGKV